MQLPSCRSTPPLRERRDDIGRLLACFLREELGRIGEGHRFADAAGEPPWLPARLVARLADLDWPGNVRQLQNVVRQMVIGSRGRDRIVQSPAIARLPAEQGVEQALQRVGAAHLVLRGAQWPETTEEELAATLRANRWDLVATAEALRGSPSASLYVLIQKSPRLRTAGSLSAEEIKRCHEECGGDVERMVVRLEVSSKGPAPPAPGAAPPPRMSRYLRGRNRFSSEGRVVVTVAGGTGYSPP